jgi:phospholipase/lecithinase/hemolysin
MMWKENIPARLTPLATLHILGENIAGGPSWVTYLTTEYNRSLILTYNYAANGAFTQQLKRQRDYDFLRHAGKKPSWAPWTSANSLFVKWIGINDIAVGLDVKNQLETLDTVAESLYDAGARNFLFINIPPLDRSPGGKGETTVRSQIADWNDGLVEMATELRENHSDVRVVVYDVAKLFAEVLDNPAKYGFKDGVSCNMFADDYVWFDSLHPTSAMHNVIAADLAQFLISEGEKGVTND